MGGSFVATPTASTFAVAQMGNSFVATPMANAFAVAPMGNPFVATQTANNFAAVQAANSFVVTQPANTFVSDTSLEPPRARKQRTSFSFETVERLNELFERNQFPSAHQFSKMAHDLKLERRVVRIWFSNKRQALKRGKS